MAVRCQLPWPLRAAGLALLCTVGAALALSAHEAVRTGGSDDDARSALAQARADVARLREERVRLLAVANTADSLLKAERAAQERLAQQLKRIEAENLALKSDLGFFERLIPAAAGAGLSIRSLQAQLRQPGHTRFQLLVMQPGKSPPEFRGRYEVTLSGTLDGKPWTFTPSGSAGPLQMKQYLRVEGTVEHPPEAVVKSVQVKVLDTSGGVRATQAATV